MRFLVFAATLPGADPTPYVEAEDARVEELLTAGVVEQFYMRADFSGAYLVVKASDLTETEKVMQSLPMAEVGLLQFTFVELAA